MPWTSNDAKRFSKKASGKGGKDYSEQWSAVANSNLEAGKDEGTAVKIANGVIKAKKNSSKAFPKVSKVNKE